MPFPLTAVSDIERVFRSIASRGEWGATCDETEVALDMLHQTCSARVRDLASTGDIQRTLRKRATRTGRPARVYVANRRSD